MSFLQSTLGRWTGCRPLRMHIFRDCNGGEANIKKITSPHPLWGTVVSSRQEETLHKSLALSSPLTKEQTQTNLKGWLGVCLQAGCTFCILYFSAIVLEYSIASLSLMPSATCQQANRSMGAADWF